MKQQLAQICVHLRECAAIGLLSVSLSRWWILLPALSAQRHLESSADGERQRGEPDHLVVMLAGQILRDRVKRDAAAQTIVATPVEPLVCGFEVAIGQQHGVAEERIAQERAIVAAAHQGTAERRAQSSARVSQGKTSAVGRATERTAALERAENANGNSGKRGIEASEGIRVRR